MNKIDREFKFICGVFCLVLFLLILYLCFNAELLPHVPCLEYKSNLK